ncbi:hypothetical protein EB796_004890 [Bugula neritina]|uniref:Uncharacterized protein n=1 Tax=Bugula neritina TaxID=10212 RepID=A0A7J7KEZ1_BUGNE|nr:hypothetical protein EB796_004890 [Bugula neritina]
MQMLFRDCFVAADMIRRRTSLLLFTAGHDDCNNTPDATYFTPVCVYWSSKGHNVMGIPFWNTMLHKVGEKLEHVNIHDQPKCLYTKFIPTRLNISDGAIAILKPKHTGSHNKNNSSSQGLHLQPVILFLMLCIFNMIFG